MTSEGTLTATAVPGYEALSRSIRPSWKRSRLRFTSARPTASSSSSTDGPPSSGVGRPKVGDTDARFCGSFRMYHLDGRLLPHARTPMATALRTGRSQRDKEVVIERPDGSRIVVRVHIDPIKDRDGGVVAAINCLQDITDRKNAEQARQQLVSIVSRPLMRSSARTSTAPSSGWNEGGASLWLHSGRCRRQIDHDRHPPGPPQRGARQYSSASGAASASTNTIRSDGARTGAWWMSL